MKNQNVTLWIMSVLIALGAEGCRLGNHADPAPTGGSISHSELFFTDLTNFQTIAYYNDGTQTINQDAPRVAVPSDLISVFTNPVYWDTYTDGTTSTQFFYDKYQSATFTTYADAAGHIPYNDDRNTAYSTAGKLYQNPNCQTQIQRYQEGDFIRTSPGTTTLPGATQTSAVSGHLTLDITSLQLFVGDCAGDLQILANCFENGATCSSDQIARARMFNLYVSQTGVLNIHDAARIIGLAYIVHFE